MLYVRTGPKQAPEINSRKTNASRNPKVETAGRGEVTPIGLVLLVIALIIIAIVGLIVLHQLPPSFISKISQALERQALPAQAVPVLTLLRDQIESLVSILRAYFIILIIASGVLMILHRFAYGASLAIFLIYSLSFFSLGTQSAALQQNVNIPEAVSIGQSLGTAYTVAAGFNLFIIFVLALLYRPYMRAWKALW